MSASTKRIPLVKYADPQLDDRTPQMPGRVYTFFFWGLLLVLCMGVCVYYSMTKPIVITSANVSNAELYDFTETVPLSLSGTSPAGSVVFTVPSGVQASDIVTENLYNERKFLIHINTDNDTYYGSFTDSGVPVDAGRINGDSNLVKGISVVYDKNGVLLIFEMTRVNEYSLTMDENVVTMEAVAPGSLYDYVVVLDPSGNDEAAGVCSDVADRCAQLLYQDGIRVYLTDTSLEAEGAVTPAELMEETGANIYIGLDVSHDGALYHGIRTYYDPLYYIPGFGSVELSESCLNNTAIAVSNRALGISEAPQGNVLYEINAPATLLTVGNCDNPDEYKLLTEDSYRDRLANGIYQAVLEAAGKMGDV